MNVDQLISDEIGEKNWRVRKVIIKTDQIMRSKTVDRLIKSTPKYIEQKVDTAVDAYVRRCKHVSDIESIPNGAILWIKHTNSGDWFLCEWEPCSDSTLLGTARVISGEHKGIGFNKWNTDQEFYDFLIVEKPKS